MVTGPTFNFVNTTTETSFEFIDELDQPCAMHEFFVSASNEAGQGMNVTKADTIPICEWSGVERRIVLPQMYF